MLSLEFACLILPHDHFGSDLDDKQCTVNDDLKFYGKSSAGVWNIDRNSVHASYINCGESERLVEPQINW